jgi:hypothetical protein
MFKTSVLALHQPEGAVLFNLTTFSTGSSAVLDRISEKQSGIYAWFRSFHFRDEPDEFADDLLAAIRAPKFQSRTGEIAPYYEVNLRSKSYIPSGKEHALRDALKNEEFLSAMKFALEWSMLFQTPLYVGKSADLKTRIGQHLKDNSPLRKRLLEAKVDIDKTYLLLVPTPVPEEVIQINSDLSELDVDKTTPTYELLFEEVFSRLFNPAFTIRLG